MPLTIKEITVQSGKVQRLVKLCNKALLKDEDGKVRLTAREASQIALACLALLPSLIIDIID